MTNFNLSKRENVKVGIDMADYCRISKQLSMPVAKIRGVDEVESAGSGFLSGSLRPKILFEGHLFYKSLLKLGFAVQAKKLEPTIAYPTWTKQFYIGREGEYARLAKATELCHQFGISDGYALKAASWGRFQILGSNFSVCGFDSVESYVEAMFVDEDNHLEAFAEYIVGVGIDDELRDGNIVGFVSKYNGPGYLRNNYQIKLPNAISKFEKQKIDCRKILEGQVVDVMPGERVSNPADSGFDNTGLDDRYLNSATESLPAAEEQGERSDIAGKDQPPSEHKEVKAEITPDGGVKMSSTEGPPLPKERVAVVAGEKQKWTSQVWAKVTGAVSGNVFFQFVWAQIEKILGLPIPTIVWAIVSTTIGLGTLIWLVHEVIASWQYNKRQERLDALLITQNSTPENLAQLIPADEVDFYRAKGFKIITRGEALATQKPV